MLRTLFSFLYLQPIRMFRKLKQLNKLLNPYRRKGGITTSVKLVAISYIGLLEVSHNNFAQPAVVGLPFEGQMSLGGQKSLSWHLHLHDEIDVELKRAGIAAEETRLLFGVHE